MLARQRQPAAGRGSNGASTRQRENGLRLGRHSAVRLFTAVLTLVISPTTGMVSCDANDEWLDKQPHRAARNAATASLLPDDVYALPAIDLDGYGRLLQELRGTPVVVNIWASWCKPCREEMPHLVEAASKFGDVVQFLGVDMQDQRGAAASFMKEFSVPFPSVFDQAAAIHAHLGFVGLPDTVFYAANGNIVDTWSGPLTEQALAEELSALMASQ